MALEPTGQNNIWGSSSQPTSRNSCPANLKNYTTNFQSFKRHLADQEPSTEDEAADPKVSGTDVPVSCALGLPITSQSPEAPLLIPQNPRSRLPTYSPILTALITSAHGRSSGKAVMVSDTIQPPILPARADPKSEDAKLMGPLSKRREVNLRRRYWKEQVVAASVPLQSLVEDQPDENKRVKWDPEKLFEMLERASIVPPSPLPSSPTKNPPPSKFPRSARFLRRRFAEVLAKTPIIKTSDAGRVSVTISSNAIDTSERHSRVRAGQPSGESLRWIELANTVGQARGEKKK
ncbi:hypothetical protein FRC01_001999 [Tulasnella sp. 417]|nr:hypothetical protein FRC01_001999 [Tulasnella sp. 417]